MAIDSDSSRAMLPPSSTLVRPPLKASPLLQIGTPAKRAAPSAFLDDDDREKWADEAPTFAHLYVDNACNLKCKHCYESEDTHPVDKAGQLSFDEYADVFKGLKALGVLVVTFSGGEPFLRRDLLDLVDLARQHRFAVRIYTSGTLINAAKADRLAAAKVSEVQISVYSADAAVHDAFTQVPGSWYRSMYALRLLHARGVKTVLKATVMRLNIDALYALKDLAHAVGARCELDPLLHPRMNGDESPLEQLVPPAELAAKFFDQPALVQVMKGHDLEDVCTGVASRGHDTPNCAAARSIVTIGAKGEVSPCALFHVDGGTVREHTLEDIWFRSKLFDRVRSTTFGRMNTCTSCEVKSTCDPCMAYGLVENDDHLACNLGSLNVATALRANADRRWRSERKMNTGRALVVLDKEHAQHARRPDHTRATAKVFGATSASPIGSDT